MIGHGVCSFSSHSWAAGRTTSAAKPWTQSRMSFWSWVSSSEKPASWAIGRGASSAIGSGAGTSESGDRVGVDIECSLGWLAS